MISVPERVKDALREGNRLKYYRFNVLNDDGSVDFTIDNDTLVYESVKFDERMCSGDTLKFGLCEGASLEFQYFDHENITGRRIQSFIDVDFKDKVKEWGEYKILTSSNPEFVVTEPGDYRLIIPPHTSCLIMMHHNGGTVYEQISDSQYTTTIDMAAWRKNEVVYVTGSGFNITVEYYSYFNQHTIPMGYFTVKKCSRQASTGIIKVTAYNKLQSDYLDAKANDLIAEQFPDSSVYLMDILRSLLGSYGIDEAETEYLTPEYDYYETVSGDAKDYFAPFRYSSFNGDQGPFSPTIIRDNYSITTSTNIYLSGEARINYYYDEALFIDQKRPVRIEVDDIIPQVDASIANFIKTQLNKINSNVSGEVLWTRVQSMQGKPNLVPNSHLKGYFFCIVVTFQDHTYKIYGNNVLNADGSFKDVEKYTFTNVMSVTVIVPLYIHFGHQLSSIDGSIDYTIWGTDSTTNKVYCYGAEHNYKSAEGIGTYQPPKMPNDDIINPLTLLSLIKVKAITGGISDVDFIELSPSSMQDVTLRELQSADYETKCQYGQLDRATDLFSGVELNRSRLLPADTLYPNNALYPDGAQESAFRSQYSKLWADEGNVHKWRYLIITYKGLDGEGNEQDYTLQRTVNNDGTDNYNCSDNWLFRNLVWTAEQIGEYADAMVAKMRDITWFPFEMWAAGLPYLETGDEIEIPLGEETYTSYILQRQLKGIQNLEDTYINGTLDIF